MNHVNDLMIYHDEDFVRAVYMAILNRPADKEGLSFYVRQIRSGVHREEVIYCVATSVEAKRVQSDLGGVADIVRKWSSVKLPVFGYFYSRKLRGGTHERELRCFINSVYINSSRFLERLEHMLCSNQGRHCSPSTNPMINLDKKFSVGVHLHVYYVDLARELLDAIENIKYNKHVYISTCDEENLGAIEQCLSELGYVNGSWTIKVVPNVGRNFASMLVTFREQLKNHDFVLHLHTKKSLRTGVEQAEWRKSSWKSLCGTSSVVETIIEGFLANPHLGLVGPVPLEGVASYWWRSWLSVGHLLKDYFGKLGIQKYQKKGLLEFPIGSMCWFRTEALAPLLNYSWSYSDFPGEPFPDDGTIAHVVERSLGVIASSQSYEYLEASIDREGRAHLSKASRLLPDYYCLINRLDSIPSEGIVSFDFFDTLFTRYTLAPEDLQSYVGFKLKQSHGVYNGYSFLKVRKEAESVARNKSSSGEVSFDAIYDSFAEVSNWPAAVIDLAKNIEIELEIKSLHPRKHILDYLKYIKTLGVRVVIVSDIYYSSDVLKTVLNKWGCSDKVDEIYVSSECLVRKDWGSMWRYLKDSERLVDWDERFIHIGDNEQSDIQQPIRNGVRALGVLNPAVMYDSLGGSLPSSWNEGETRWEDGLIIGPVVARLCNSPVIDPGVGLQLNSPADFGFSVVGPVLFGFSRWLIEQAKFNVDLREFAFVARDGWYLKSAYDRITSVLPPAAYIPSVYFEVSRQALFSVASDSKVALDLSLSSGSFNGSVKDFFAERFGVESDLGFDNLLISLPGDEEVVRSVYGKNRRLFERLAHESRDRFFNYLDQIGFDRQGRSALVDLGYSGTIQAMLQNILGVGLDGYYFAVNKGVAKVSSDLPGRAFGYFGDGRDDNSPMSIVLAYSLIFEAVFSAPRGRVIGYDSTGKPQYSSSVPIDEHKFGEAVMIGAFEYIDLLLDQYGGDLFNMEFDPHGFTAVFDDVIRGRISISDNLRSRFIVEDNFSGNGYINPFSVYRI